MKKLHFSLLCFILQSLTLSAQEVWDVERCIREALANSLTVKQVALTKTGHDIEGKRLRWNQVPSLNANSDLGLSSGRVINPVTNLFETENQVYQTIGINAGVMVFNGFRLRNSIRQNDILVDASEADLKQAEDDLALNVALAYLNVLFAYENLEIAKKRVDLSEHQLEQLDKMIATGTKPENDRFDILAQIAADQGGVVTAENNIENNLLVLKQQMLMEADYPLVIERPALDVSNLEALENQTVQTVYDLALSTQPQVQAAELRQQADEMGVDIASSQMYPSLSIGGQMGTNWSDATQAPIFGIQRIEQPGVYINDESVKFEADQFVPISSKEIAYTKQLNNNIGYGLGLSLSVPIFNNNNNRAAVENAKIQIMNSAIQTDLVKQALKTDIQNAITAARASRKSLEASEATAKAASIALKNADRLTEIGSINNFEYLSARNRSDTAQLNVLIAKYDYFFKVKVIEYYMGRGITLD